MYTTHHRKQCFVALMIVTLAICAHPVRGESITALKLHSERVEIVGRAATTTVSQTFVNYTDRQREVVVTFRLPPGAAVDSLAMWVNGLRSPAVLHPRMAAKQIYREIRDARRDPALLEYMGADRWRLSVFPVLPNNTQKIEFKFTSVLGLRNGRCIYRGMKITGGSFTEALDFECSANIRYLGGIRDVHALSDPLGVQRLKGRIELGFRAANRQFNQPAGFAFTPEIAPSNVVAFKDADGRKYYAAVIDPFWEAPRADPIGREIVIVLDASASMKGKSFIASAKVVQAILADLTQRDKFGVIVAGSDVAVFTEKLLPASKDSKLKAVKWLTGFMPKGATDLAGALRAVESLNKNPKAPLNVFLVTDGRDSIGAKCAKKKEKSPFLTAAEKLPNRPPDNCRFFVCDIAGGGTVLDFLAESTGGKVALIGNDDPEDVADYMKPLLDASRISDPIAGVTLREIVAKNSTQTALSDIGRSRPDHVNGIVITGLWPGPGKRTLEATLHRTNRGRSIKYELDFPKNIDARLGPVSLHKVWAHQRADRMWDKLQSINVKIGEVQALMAFSRSHGIITRAMAMLVLESDEDYIKRGIKRTGSSVTVRKSLTQRSVDHLLIEIVRANLSRRHGVDSRSAEQIATIKQQALELQRRGEIAASARLFNDIASAIPGQFEARRRATLIGEYAALKNSFNVDKIVRESHDEVLDALVGRGKWHEIVMQTEPTRLALHGDTEKPAATLPPPPAVALAQARKTPPPASEAREDKLLARKIPKIDMKNAALKDVLAKLETPKEKLTIRWDKLALEEIKPSTTISVKMDNVPLEEALEDILAKAAGLSREDGDYDWPGRAGFRVDDKGITISSRRDLGVNTYIRSYDIQDLVAYSINRDRWRLPPISSMQRTAGLITRGDPEDAFLSQVGDNSSSSVWFRALSSGTASDWRGRPTVFELDRWEPRRSNTGLFDTGAKETGLFDSGFDGGLFDGGFEGDLRSPNECIAEIKALLTGMIDRDSWRDAGGEAGAVNSLNGVLMIQQTRANHKAIARMLDNLREMWRKRLPVQIAKIPDSYRRPRHHREEIEDPFTAKGRIARWLEELLDQAAASKLSKFSSIRVEKTGSRTFARICGVWFDTSLTSLCKIHAVETDSPAHAAVLNTGAVKKYLALGRYVIIRVDDSSAIYVNRDGIFKADDKQLKKMIATLAKR